MYFIGGYVSTSSGRNVICCLTSVTADSKSCERRVVVGVKDEEGPGRNKNRLLHVGSVDGIAISVFGLRFLLRGSSDVLCARSDTLSMIYKGHRGIGLKALNFLSEISIPGPKGGTYYK